MLSLWKKKISYSFNKVDKNLSAAKSIELRTLNKRKNLIIQKTYKGNTAVITECTKYLEEIKSLLPECSKFMQLPIDEDKWINYIINTESKLKDYFKVPEVRTKFQKNNLIVFAQLALFPPFYKVILKYIKQSLTTLQNFDLFYQQ